VEFIPTSEDGRELSFTSSGPQSDALIKVLKQ
jgi:hypothetical protein